jgi:hypothetical protein
MPKPAAHGKETGKVTTETELIAETADNRLRELAGCLLREMAASGPRYRLREVIAYAEAFVIAGRELENAQTGAVTRWSAADAMTVNEISIPTIEARQSGKLLTCAAALIAYHFRRLAPQYGKARYALLAAIRNAGFVRSPEWIAQQREPRRQKIGSHE